MIRREVLIYVSGVGRHALFPIPCKLTAWFQRYTSLAGCRNTKLSEDDWSPFGKKYACTFGSTFGSVISYSPGIQQFQCTKLRYIDTSSLITDLAFRLAFIVP